MSTKSACESVLHLNDGDGVRIVEAAGFPPPRHPAESGIFARHEGVPGHVQSALSDANILIVGAGGLGGWIALALARAGARHLAIVDHDRFDLTNASRQLMLADDLEQPKAYRVAHNIAPHMVAGGTAIGLSMPFDVAVQQHAVAADVLLVGVDDNRCRYHASEYARSRRIPAIFTMLSLDATRIHAFLQGPNTFDACLWCALPNLDPEGLAPCASGVITSCLMAASLASFFAHRALMGWPDSMTPFNWRATDITGMTPEEIGHVPQRQDCRCGGSA